MANIGEVGETVQNVLGQQAAELAALISNAHDLSGNMCSTFSSTVTGSDNERTEKIQERLLYIQAHLGETGVAANTV